MSFGFILVQLSSVALYVACDATNLRVRRVFMSILQQNKTSCRTVVLFYLILFCWTCANALSQVKGGGRN